MEIRPTELMIRNHNSPVGVGIHFFIKPAIVKMLPPRVTLHDNSVLLISTNHQLEYFLAKERETKEWGSMGQYPGQLGDFSTAKIKKLLNGIFIGPNISIQGLVHIDDSRIGANCLISGHLPPGISVNSGEPPITSIQDSVIGMGNAIWKSEVIGSWVLGDSQFDGNDEASNFSNFIASRVILTSLQGRFGIIESNLSCLQIKNESEIPVDLLREDLNAKTEGSNILELRAESETPRLPS